MKTMQDQTVKAPNKRFLPFTRGALLENICALCAILKQADRPLAERELAALAKDVFQKKVSARPSSHTRFRHHFYALLELKLAAKCNRRYSLEPRGQELAALVLQETDFLQRPPTLSSPILRDLLSTIMVESPYVRSEWLRYFMPKEDFTLQELLATAYPIIIEVKGNNYCVNWKGGSPKVLDDKERMEIYQGLRKWTNDIELTDEVLLDEQSLDDEQDLHSILGFGSRFVEAYVVRRQWDERTQVELFEEKVRSLIDEVGNGNHIGIPDLIIALCRKERLSKRTVRELLESLYREKGAKYFFERASRLLLRLPFGVEPENYYVKIDGIWRTGLVAV